MMLAHLQSAREKSTSNADSSRAIILMDFREAYGTVDRNFMVEAPRHFGFDENLLALINVSIRARFAVNCRLSSLWTFRPGIRQGCLLAPLLFLVSVEVLAVAIQTSP